MDTWWAGCIRWPGALPWPTPGRLKRRRQHEVTRDPGHAPAIDTAGGSERLRAEIDEALARMPAQLREAVLLCHLEGRSQREAAAITGCPIGTMGWRAAKGLERLRVILRRRLAAGDVASIGTVLLALDRPATQAQLAAMRALPPPLAKGALAKGVAAKTALWIAAGAIVAASAVLGVMVARARVPAAVQPTATPSDFGPNGSDAIADFTPATTIVSVADGAWSSPTTWSPRRVPGAADAVAIARGTAVTYDIASDARLAAVAVRSGGTLRFRTDRVTRLVAADVLIRAGGRLSIGSAEDPVRATAELVIADDLLDPVRDPRRFGDGLVVYGTLSMCGEPRTAFMRLSAEPRAGDRSLRLLAAPQGWQAGDHLGLPDTRQLDWNEHGAGRYASQWEDAILVGVSADGAVASLAAPLAFAHGGARDASGVLDAMPHVLDQTRTVVVRSLNPSGRRGHVWASHRAEIDLRYAAFIGLGRSTAKDPPEDSRCALGFASLLGPERPAADGHQLRLIGNVVDGLVHAADGARGGIMLNACHFGLVADNIVRDVAGVGIELAAGSSRNDQIGTFVTGVHGNGELYTADADAGVGYHIRNPDNTVRGNIANQMADGPYSSGFVVDGDDEGALAVPSAPGREPDRRIEMSALPLREFARNEAYGALGIGFRASSLGSSRGVPKCEAGAISDCRVWHQFTWALLGTGANRLTIERFSVRGDPANHEGATLGMFFSDANQRDLAIKDADIQGEAAGIRIPNRLDSPMLIEGGRLANATDILVMTPSAYSGGGSLGPRRTIIRNVSFKAQGDAGRPCIGMSYVDRDDKGECNYAVGDEVLVYGFNRVPGDDFRVYYREQRPEFTVPMSTGGGRLTVGCPEAGLTKADCLRKYGIAIAGCVAPTAATRPGIAGLVGPIPAGPASR